jgi:hypothetical protein
MTTTIKGIVLVVVLGLLLAAGTLGYQLYDDNEELKNQIAQRDSLIKRIQASDSLSCQFSGRYDSVVTRYITNDCSLLIDGKKISLDKFIDIYAKQVEERAVAEIKLAAVQNQLGEIGLSLGELQKALRVQDLKFAVAQDSLSYYKSVLRTVKKTYGIKLNSRIDGKYRITNLETKQLDSALVLLQLYRHRMRYDSLTHVWTVTTEFQQRLPTTKKK